MIEKHFEYTCRCVIRGISKLKYATPLDKTLNLSMKLVQIFQPNRSRLAILILLFGSFCTICSNIYGQIVTVQSPPFDINAGLPNNEIREIIQDKSGYFWIATDNGLSRFDGYHFENFNSISHPNIFRDNKINQIKKNGDLFYILTEKDGLIELNTQNLAFKKLSNDKPLSVTFSNDTSTFLFDTGLLLVKQNNRILFQEKTVVSQRASALIYRGDLLLSANSKDIYRINLGNPAERTNIPMPFDNSSGQLLLSTAYGVINWNGWQVFILKNNAFVDHPEFIDKVGISFFDEEPSGAILRIENNTIPHATLHGFYYALPPAKESNLQYRCICRVNDNAVFIGTNQGMVLFSYQPALSERIVDYRATQQKEATVQRRIVEHNNKRYFLGFPHILEQNEGGEMVHLTDTTPSSYDGLVFKEQLYFTADGRRTLLSLNLKTKKLTTHLRDDTKEDEKMEGISVLSDSTLIITSENKITAYTPTNKRVQEFRLDPGITLHTAHQLGKTNFILLGTSQGLYRVQFTNNNGFTYVDHPCTSILEIRDILIRENQNELWLATNSGVAVMQLDDLVVKRIYNNTFEVSNPRVTSLIEDLNGCIWASTYLGITVYNTNDGSIRFVKKSHGLINNEFNYTSACLLKSGNLIFGGLNGFEIIDPTKLNDFQYSKNFNISGLEYIQSDKTKQFSNYQEGQTISFQTRIETIVIHLAHLDYVFKKGYSFRYSIDGKNWFETDEKGSLVLSNLSYGEYNLKIQMFDPFGSLVQEKSFPIVALAPFYKKTSFYISLGIILLGIIVLLWYYVLRSYRIRMATKRKIAMDLHDESGTILTRLLILSKKQKFEAKEKEQIQQGLAEALYIFRTYLDSISDENDWVQNLSDDLNEFITSACTDAHIQFTFKVILDRNYKLKRELYRDIKLSVYEIVTNVLKHANADTLSVEFTAEKQILTLSITDNGTCNLSDLATQKGNGIRNISNRAKRNKGTIIHCIKDGETGLTTKIQIPIA